MNKELNCNTCIHCETSPLYRGVCTKVKPNHIFTEEDRQKWFVKDLTPDWCPLIPKSVEKVMNTTTDCTKCEARIRKEERERIGKLILH